MKNWLCVVFALGFLSGIVKGQQIDSTAVDTTQVVKVKKDTRPFIKRLSLGGSTGFWINTKETFLEVSPMLAYHFPKTLTTGVGYRYIYHRNRIYGKNLNTFGPNIFARANLTKRIYLWTEWEFLNSEYVAVANQETSIQTDHIQSLFAGLGYMRSFGKRSRGGISFQLLYNFLYEREDNSPYIAPITYRVGYFF
jgi:hypothetical protein